MCYIALVAVVVFVEGLTELLCKSLFFNKVRLFLSSRSSFLNDLLKCGYCTSVWVSFIPSLFMSVYFFKGWGSSFVGFVFLTVVFHRLSNYLHNFNDKHLDKFYDQRLKR